MLRLFDSLRQMDRMLLEVPLRPAQGTRFQPTGFPDLGSAEYEVPIGSNGQKERMLLVESAQSVANRLESACWDEARDDLAEPLRGMPYVRVAGGGRQITNSILEAHRLNSPYILDASQGKLLNALKVALEPDSMAPVDISKLAATIFHYDPNCVLHGLFLARGELAGGRYRMRRLLSGFIEARGVERAESGGVKNDRVDPRGAAASGLGNVPYHRTEYTARGITAYFNFDLAQLRAYRLGQRDGDNRALNAPEQFLVTLALWKIDRFLASGLRLRTACDLSTAGELTTSLSGTDLPDEAIFAAELPKLIGVCRDEGLFTVPPITEVEYVETRTKTKAQK